MTCNLILDWLDDYLEGQLDPQNSAKFEKHIEECESCRMLLDDLKSMREVMGEMPLMPLPSDFNESLHEKLIIAAEEIKAGFNIKEKSQEKFKKKGFNFSKKQFNQYMGAAAVIALLVVSGYQLKDQVWWTQQAKDATYDMADAGGPLEMPPMPQTRAGTNESAVTNQAADAATFGVGASPESATVTGGMAKTAGSEAGATGASGTDTGVNPSAKIDVTLNRDLIRSGDVNLKIADYDKFYTAIENLINQSGGYIESSYTGMTPYYENNKFVGDQLMGSVVLRIPSDQFKTVYEAVKTMGVLQSGQQNVQDVTTQISDLKATLSNLKARETSLRALMSKAKNVTEIMEVERELSSVRTQIDQLESSLKGQQQQVSLSTLYINVQVSPEVGNQFKNIDGNLVERAKQALIKNINTGIRIFEALFVGLVAWLPVILVAGLGFFGIKHTKSYKKWRHKND